MRPLNFVKAASLTACLIAAPSIVLFNAVISPLRAEPTPATPVSDADWLGLSYQVAGNKGKAVENEAIRTPEGPYRISVERTRAGLT